MGASNDQFTAGGKRYYVRVSVDKGDTEVVIFDMDAVDDVVDITLSVTIALDDLFKDKGITHPQIILVVRPSFSLPSGEYIEDWEDPRYTAHFTLPGDMDDSVAEEMVLAYYREHLPVSRDDIKIEVVPVEG